VGIGGLIPEETQFSEKVNMKMTGLGE